MLRCIALSIVCTLAAILNATALDDATSVGGYTTLNVDPLASLSTEMLGWVVQLNINQQVLAPPGTTTFGARAGVVMDPYCGGGVWVGASSSRRLYGGCRYELPAAGVTQFSLSQLIVTQRQGGQSFGGFTK